MRTVLSEEAAATMGRTGCGAVIQERVVEGGESEARGLIMRGREEPLGDGMMLGWRSSTSGYWSKRFLWWDWQQRDRSLAERFVTHRVSGMVRIIGGVLEDQTEQCESSIAGLKSIVICGSFVEVVTKKKKGSSHGLGLPKIRITLSILHV